MKAAISSGHRRQWRDLERIGLQLGKERDPTGARRKLSKTSASTLEELAVTRKRTRIAVAQGQDLSRLRAPNHGNQGQVLSQPSVKVSQTRIMLIRKNKIRIL